MTATASMKENAGAKRTTLGKAGIDLMQSGPPQGSSQKGKRNLDFPTQAEIELF